MPEQMALSEAVEILLDSIAEYDFATPADTVAGYCRDSHPGFEVWRVA